MGAIVTSISGPDGFVHLSHGITNDQLGFMHQHYKYDSVEPFAEKYHFDFYPNEKPWIMKADIALPCALQNEILAEDINLFIENDYQLIAEGTHIPCTKEAIDAIQKTEILFAPSKASSTGGIAVSGIECTLNSTHVPSSKSDLDEKLQLIMKSIHQNCLQYGLNDGQKINYQKGANIAAFVKIADAMLEQGLV